MESGKVYRTNPFTGGPSRNKTLTLTESGLLHHAMVRRRQEQVLKRYRQMRSSRIRRMFFKDLDKTIQNLTGRTLAKFVYGMWSKGYFDKFEDFASSKKARRTEVEVA